MNPNIIRYFILVPGPRPDFRQVQAFLWGDDKGVDSDGNSYNPASRDWTELTLITRDSTEERFDIEPVQTDPLVLEVTSRSRHLAARVAYVLGTYTGGAVSATMAGPFADPESVRSELGLEFDLGAAVHRFTRSRFARSTLEDPNPE